MEVTYGELRFGSFYYLEAPISYEACNKKYPLCYIAAKDSSMKLETKVWIMDVSFNNLVGLLIDKQVIKNRRPDEVKNFINCKDSSWFGA